MADTQRQTCCFVTHHNGAWLIHWTGGDTHDMVDSDLYNCASNIKVAKRLAVLGARDMGFTGPARWEQHPEYGGWTLDMTWTDDYEYDYTHDEVTGD